ncbi:MAG: hypothetical protein AAFX87_21190, partial [Bacteroidota bacterium]
KDIAVRDRISDLLSTRKVAIYFADDIHQAIQITRWEEFDILIADKSSGNNDKRGWLALTNASHQIAEVPTLCLGFLKSKKDQNMADSIVELIHAVEKELQLMEEIDALLDRQEIALSA